MSEWLDLMLEETDKKKRELKEAEEEHARRAGKNDTPNESKQESDSK